MKEESETTIEEHGVFKRKYWRKGKKKKQKTERAKKNPKKVTLMKLRSLELFVYPYDYPEKVFLGQYPNFNYELDETEIRQLFQLYNRARWFVEGKWQEECPKRKKKLKALRDAIISAYNLGLKEKRRKKKA